MGVFRWANKHKEHLATLSLIFGFFVDIITFRTINLSLSQTILSVHLAIVAFSILVLSIPTKEKRTFFGSVRSWIPVLQQYSMGNLLSGFLILYAASGAIFASWPFLALVAVGAIGNEVIKLQKYRLPFHTTLFFLNLLLFTALAVPIAANHIGVTTFILSVVVASITFIVYVRIGRMVAPSAFKQHWRLIRVGWVSVSVVLLTLYFTNLIPPIPLSVKSAYPAHLAERSGETYTTVREVHTTWDRVIHFFTGETLHLAPGESAYVFTSVFAPADFSEDIVHKWQFFNEKTSSWETTHTAEFPIVGGRRGGYRGFSLSQYPREGRWRVSVETARSQVIGRVYFFVEHVPAPVVTESYAL